MDRFPFSLILPDWTATDYQLLPTIPIIVPIRVNLRLDPET